MIAVWSVLVLAHAGPQLGLALGGEVSANDPFVVRRGPSLGAELRPIPVLGVGLAAAWYPDLGQADWTALTRRLVFEQSVTPDLSRMLGRQQLALSAYPFRGRGERENYRLVDRTDA